MVDPTATAQLSGHRYLGGTVKVVWLDPSKVTNRDLYNKWECLWLRVYAAHCVLTTARQAGEPITVDMMQAFDKARNDERQFFRDNFFVQHD